MTGHKVAIPRVTLRWFDLTAPVHHHGTTGVKTASLGGIERRWHIPGEDDASFLFTLLDRRHRRQKRLRVGMHGGIEEPFGRRHLYQAAEIHYHDTVAQIADHAKIVGNK